MKEYVIPASVEGSAIKEIRNQLGMTQKEFAAFVGCSKPTVERWESGNKPVTGPIVTLIEILKRDVDLPGKLQIPGNKLKLRLYYMYKDMVCTIIDIDEPKRKVIIHNYIDKPIFRAFGKNTEPSFEEYEAFIESRCFPRSRDKIKLELKKLDIPFYDPVMIIEKTQGRMADDDFWIRIER